MCFLNVLQRVKFGRSQRYHQTHVIFPPVLSSQRWIIFLGEFSQTWMIINLYEYYGTFGKGGTTNYLVIFTLIPEKNSN